MNTPDERTPLSAVIKHNEEGRLIDAQVKRDQLLIAIMMVGNDRPRTTDEDRRAFDREAERLCRLFAQAERMEAALRRFLAVHEDRCDCEDDLEFVCRFCEARAVLAALSEAAARAEEGTR